MRSCIRRLRPWSLLAAMPLFCATAYAQSGDANQLVKLIDYMGADYGRAVSGGVVQNEAEYEEMRLFQQRAAEKLEELLQSDSDDEARRLRAEIGRLGLLIEKRVEPSEVALLSKSLREKAIRRFGVRSTPPRPPSLQAGKTLYAANCAVCHGPGGGGDGSVASLLSPEPASFLDREIMEGLSPFRAYNVITYGVEGTPMPGYAALADADRWDLAFYLFALRHANPPAQEPPTLGGFDLAEFSDLTDGQLLAKLKRESFGDADDALAFFRARSPFVQPKRDPVSTAERLLETAGELYRQGKISDARDSIFEAYFEGVEPIEPRLRITDSELVTRIETGFQALHAAVKRGAPADELASGIAKVREDLADARIRLEQKPQSAAESFWISLLIILREGVEAALIVGAILGLLRAGGDASAARWMHAGWIVALLAGALTWLASQTLISISGAGRELVEGIAALAASAVLFYVSYWLLSKYDVQRWMSFIQSRVQRSLAGGSLFALFGLTFLAVYRESFETVLFYQALVQNAPGAGAPIGLGFLVGAALLIGLVFAMFRLGMKLPLRHFFLISGCLLYLLAFVLAGKGIWALQEGGFVGITPVGVPSVPLLGVYATLEGLLLQGAFLLAVLIGGLWALLRRDPEENSTDLA